MSIRHAIWKVAAKPEPLSESSLAKEQMLEEMIVADPRILSDEWMLIGRQEDTGYRMPEVCRPLQLMGEIEYEG